MKSLSDLTVPATVQRKLLEKDVQKQCVDWARARGYWARKFSSQSQRSVPDYLFARKVGAAALKFAVEFKAPHRWVQTDAQTDEAQRMIDAGWEVAPIINDFETFRVYVQDIERRYT